VLRVLAHNPSLTQREIAAQIGMSTSGLNYVLHSLVDRGLIKVRNFLRQATSLATRICSHPRMILQAQNELSIDLTRSVLVGDTVTDSKLVMR